MYARICLTALLFAAPLLADGVIMVPRDPNPSADAQRDAARQAAMKAAQGEVDKAQALVAAAANRIRAAWKANPDLLAAEKDLEAKQAAYAAARAPVIAKLEQDPAYRDARAAAADAEALVTQAKAAPRATQPTAAVVDAATAKLEQKSVLREMEDKALAADETAAKAKADLDAAREKRRLLQLQFDAALLNDPEYKQALEQLNAAKSRLTAATAQP
jgi:hypothetical protein